MFDYASLSDRAGPEYIFQAETAVAAADVRACLRR